MPPAKKASAKKAPAKKAEGLDIEVAGHELTVTNPDKVFFSERGETKIDLVNYYRSMEDPIMRSMGGRPVLMQRFPDGAEGPNFFQKRVPEKRPEWLETATVATPNGTTAEALVIGDIGHVIWAVNLGCLGFHVWPARAADLEHADELRIDLDPNPNITYEMIREGAHEVRALLGEVGITSHPKTSGNKGLHIYVRLERGRWNSYEVRAACVAFAREIERRRPDLLTGAWWKEERGDRVFIDYNQNAPHKTIFGAWSVRARPGAQVSAPLSWDEIDTVHPDELTIANVPDRVEALGDPWLSMETEPQSIEPLLEWSARDMAAGLMDAPWPPVYPKQPNEPPRVAPSRAKKPS